MSEEFRNNQNQNQDGSNNGSNQDAGSFYHYSYQQNKNQDNMNASGKNPKNDKDFKKILARAAAIALVVGVVGGSAFGASGYLRSHYSGAESIVQAAGTEDETDEMETAGVSEKVDDGREYSVKEVVANAMPAMVAITNQGVTEVRDYFFGETYQRATESTGSGVIIDQNDEELLIATNNHVVAGAETLTVCFTVDAENNDDLVVSAKVKGADPNHDLAIVSVSLADVSDDVKSKIKVLETGSSENLELGEQVVAIGNALGYGQSVTSGYVSALNREVSVETDDGNVVTNSMIQTDASINPGNSGGALLNMKGELIGINSVKAQAVGIEGLGYAIPIDTALPIFDELKEIQSRELVDEDERGFMGITPVDITSEAKQIYNMPSGAYVYQINEDSAAAKAGVKKGDIITKMDGVIISSADDLYDRMMYYAEGDELTLTIQRSKDGEYEEQVITLTLDKKPKTTTTTTQNQNGNGSKSGSRSGQGWNNGYDNGDDGETESEEYVDPFSQIFPEYFRR